MGGFKKASLVKRVIGWGLGVSGFAWRLSRSDAGCYNVMICSVINVFCESGNVEGFMMVFNEMIGKKVCPHVA